MDETSIISKLESSDPTGIHALFSDYLSPFSDLTNPPKPKRLAKSKPKAEEDRQTLARSLAKKFLPLLNRALSAIPKLLDDRLKLGGGDGDGLAQEFFETYRLCLDCLEAVSSQLSGKPYSVQYQRLRLVHCFDAWRRWKEAESECFGVLERLKEGNSGPRSRKCERSLLPEVEKGADDELAKLVVDIVARLVRYVFASESKDIDDYSRVLRLVEESRAWFRVLDANTYEKLHRVLVTYLGKCTTILVLKLKFVDEDLVRSFCFTTMTELANSSARDTIYKVARTICSSLFSLQDSRSTFTINTLICLLDSLFREGKVECNGVEFVELIAYISNKCKTSPDFCSTIGSHLNKIEDSQVKLPFHWILRLYATGLLVMNYKLKSQSNDISSLEGLVGTLCASDVLRDLAALLNSLRSYFHKGRKKNCNSFSSDDKYAVCLLCSPSIFHNVDSMGETHENGEACALTYLNALKFICLPLAEVVNLEKKQIISRDEAAAVSIGLCYMQEAFHQFSDAFFFFKRFKSNHEEERDGCNDTSILSIAVASFIVSLRTKLNMQKSVNLLEDVISSEWIQPNALKYLFSSLYNIGVTLYKDGQLTEALEALKLSNTASWTCVLRLCDMFIHKLDGSSDDLSEDAIVNFVNESCTRNSCLLNSFLQHDSHEAKRMIIQSLENWSVASDIFSKLPGPKSLVKQWVKIESHNHKNYDVQDNASTLYEVLSGKVSKRTIGIILEQELHAYAEVNPLHPELCQKMQLMIIGYLLEDVYVTPESWLQRSRILVQKGRVLRFYGHCLKDCIQCLSDAISSIEVMSGETCNYDVQTSHQLGVAYCLRACCTQEAEPNSKQVFQDIRMALKLWLSITTPDCSAEEMCFTAPENMMILLYNIADMLSITGCMDFHYDIYRLLFRLFKRKKMPLEKSVAVLWECRRLGHALCVSPLNEAFLMSVADNYDGLTKSIDFWISCLEGSKALLVGFEHNFSFLFANFPRGSFNHESSFRSNITLEEVKKAAFQLISGVPPSTSVFVAGHLFYDLSERLISNGNITEALTFAKEAHRLRAALFTEKFKFSVEQKPENSNNSADAMRKATCSLQDLQVRSAVANELWSLDTISWDLENCYLSPWIVLQCYLESTLQVGVACELSGNGAEAENLLLWGKSISCLTNLPLFMASFSSVLGKLYCKKQLWDVAQKELHDARQCLNVSSTEISCSKCRLVLEVTVDQQLGDLSLNFVDNSTGSPSIESSSHAGALYKSAVDKLNRSEWESSSGCPELACSRCFVGDIVEKQQDVKKPSRKEPKETKEVKKCGKTRNASKPAAKDQNPMPEKILRTTRSRSRSSENKSMSSKVQVSELKHLRTSNVNESCSDTCCQTEDKSSKVDFGCEGVCICNKMRCWHCLQIEVTKNGLLKNLIDMKWEYFRRRLLLRSLISLGNYLESRGQIHEAHKSFLQSILILVNQDFVHLTTSSVPATMLLDTVGKEVSEDTFIIERAELLYSLTLASLKCHDSQGTRVACCDMSHIQLTQSVAWLIQVFVSCCEVPVLFQKVSRLLAVIFVLAAAGEICSLSSCCKAVSENQWASFFHQASIGTHLNRQFFTNHDWISKIKDLSDAKASYLTGSTCLGPEIQNFPRLVPESIQDLEAFIHNFFVDFPSITASCISLLGHPYRGLLQEMLHYNSSTHAWLLISRLDSRSQPVVLLLPVDSILEEASDDAGVSYCSETKNPVKNWKCPWGFSVVDNVAPVYRLILEENDMVAANFPLEDTVESKRFWWTRRKKLDHFLGKFLADLEDLWLGPWKYMLLGPRSNSKSLDPVHKKLTRSLKSKCKMDINESVLRVMLGAPMDTFQEEEFISWLCLRNGCYIGRTGWCHKDGHCASPSDSGGLDKLSSLALQLVGEAVNELESEGCIDREPVMLVLDFDVQMLPWENIPILRSQEVYRMPSVWSISAILNRSSHYQDKARNFPSIDPLDAFYLLNPGGDLSDTQNQFEKWFQDQNLEGKAGCAPPAEELAAALKNHDLFMYFGHGSGSQYIPGREIQKLENCAATLLMGCSSGALTLDGCYAPKGTPLSYLLASSPVIVANLWNVTDKDIDRFGKNLLEAWFKERVTASSGCATCTLVAEELEALSLQGGRGNAKKKVTWKPPEPGKGESSTKWCDHRPKIGSFIAQARDACLLRYLIGAAPVCYGVPTGIRNKKDLG